MKIEPSRSNRNRETTPFNSLVLSTLLETKARRYGNMLEKEAKTLRFCGNETAGV